MLYSVKGIRFDRVKVVRTADTVTEVIGAPSPGVYTIMAPVMGANPLNPLVQVTVMDLSPTSITMKLVTGAGGTVRVEGQEEGEEKVRGEKGEEGGERVTCIGTQTHNAFQGVCSIASGCTDTVKPLCTHLGSGILSL